MGGGGRSKERVWRGEMWRVELAGADFVCESMLGLPLGSLVWTKTPSPYHEGDDGHLVDDGLRRELHHAQQPWGQEGSAPGSGTPKSAASAPALPVVPHRTLAAPLPADLSRNSRFRRSTTRCTS